MNESALNLITEGGEPLDVLLESADWKLLLPSRNTHVRAEIDWSWARKIVGLQSSERQAQYQLACLSTLGGGYFLCNKHETALSIASDLLRLGAQLHNNALVVRALVYIAVNLNLVGKKKWSRRIFKMAYLRAKNNKYLTDSINTSRMWLEDYAVGLQAKADAMT